MNDFFEDYFAFVGDSEAPALYHRWCCISMLGAWLGRDMYFPFGHSLIYPNQYVLLMGKPGARKSSALGIAKNIMKRAGYKTFAKERTSKERFFMDMVRKVDVDYDDDIEDLEALVIDAPSETYIANGEFLDFIGQGNMDFLTALTNLWDNLDAYEHPKIHGKSVMIDRPTLNILGGATVKGLGMAIPSEALGTGILSRLILVHSDPSDRKITFPRYVPSEASDEIVERLKRIKLEQKGEITKDALAEKLLDKMYKKCPGIDDGRFEDYSSRRFIHLLKLSMLLAVSRNSNEINGEDALKANTILHATEVRMNKALGEFGKSKYSDVSNTIIEVLNKTITPVSHGEMWKIVAKDLNDARDLSVIMKNLLSADKVQVMTISGKQGYMPLHIRDREWEEGLILTDYLTSEEMM